MKILFVDRQDTLSIGRLVATIAAEALERGHEVVLCRFADGRERPNAPVVAARVQVIDIEVGPRRSRFSVVRQLWRFSLGFRKVLRQQKPDLVHTQFAIPGGIAEIVARMVGVPVIVASRHEMFTSLGSHLRLLVQLARRAVDAEVFVSRTVAGSYGADVEDEECSTISGQGGVWPRKQKRLAQLIHNGIDFRAPLPRRGDGETILCVGRLVPEKGQETLIRALPRIVAVNPKARLDLVGEGPDKERLKHLANNLGVGLHVNWLGWQPYDAVMSRMSTAAVIAMPSEHEGFGMVLIEALAAGCPVVASDIPAFREVGANTPVKYSAPGDPREWAKSIVDELVFKPVDSEQLKKGQSAVWERFNAARMTVSYLRLYEKLAHTSVQK